ncbi:MAG: ABC transporter permease [Thermoflexaceae bacterium]|nr:ABC transporter permease [Thermoflexaceae bacterium]
MRFLDIIGMSASNLWRRKLRTFLTVLGVMIGTTSIVVMVSLGIGLKAAVMEQYEAYGSMTEIEVYNYSWGSDSDLVINDSMIEQFRNIPHVTEVTPILNMSAQLYQGKYAAWVQINGVSQEYLSKMEVGEGELPSATSGQVELLIGNAVIQDFYQTSNYKYPYYEDGVLADVDLMGRTLFTQFESTSGDGQEQPAKKNVFPVAGIIAGGTETYNQYSYGVYVDIDALKSYLKKTYKGKVIPGQPTGKNGKPLKEFVYNNVIVAVDDTENVSDVLTTIKDMGFQGYSQAEWIQQAEQQMLTIQAVLGGIGAVAMLVAAISIANTMMMSTYERTKEIGVMKVLGCSLGNIRGLFLTEAAFIGFIGGAVGLVLSYILSAVCNQILPEAMGYGGAKLSLIPWWLAILAVVFAAVVGIVAGFFPAQRATKLSPLAAIRNE